jgi:hypothetical protein
MSVIIKTKNGVEVTIDGIELKCTNKIRLVEFNNWYRNYYPTDYAPDRDYQAAEAFVKKFGGEIIASDEVESREGVVY